MTASFWVYLSTICFLLIVFFVGKNTIVQFLNDKRKKIIHDLDDIKEKKDKAEALYEEYRQKMDGLEAKTNKIIKDAEETAAEIVASVEHDIEQYKYLKNKELDDNLVKYEAHIKKEIYRKYAHYVVDVLKKQTIEHGQDSKINLH